MAKTMSKKPNSRSPKVEIKVEIFEFGTIVGTGADDPVETPHSRAGQLRVDDVPTGGSSLGTNPDGDMLPLGFRAWVPPGCDQPLGLIQELIHYIRSGYQPKPARGTLLGDAIYHFKHPPKKPSATDVQQTEEGVEVRLRMLPRERHG